MAVEYRDPTPFTDEEKSDIAGVANAIRTKMYGKDVRESIATALEKVSTDKANYISTPKGVADNLAALQAQFPNGNTGIYITRDDGHWHFYNYKSSKWVDGGPYLTDLLNLEESDISLFGINLLNGTKATTQSQNVGAITHTNVTASNGDKLKLTPGRQYTYHAYIHSAPVNGHVAVTLLDKNMKTLSKLNGNQYQNNASGLSKVTFIMPEDAVYATFWVLSTSTSINGKVRWSKEMLEIGHAVSDFEFGIGEVNSGDAIAMLIRAVGDRGVIDNIRLEGINLLDGTSNIIQTENFVNANNIITTTANTGFLSVSSNKTYTYHAEISNNPEDSYVSVVCFDQNKNVVRTVMGNVIPKNSHGLSKVIFTTDNDVKYIVPHPVAWKNKISGSVDYVNEMLEYGDIVHYWTRSTNELNAVPALTQLVKRLNDDRDNYVRKNSAESISASNVSLPIIKIGGDSTNLLNENIESVLPFTFHQDGKTVSAYVKMEWQGNSSLRWKKKGFKFKAYKDEGATDEFKFQPTPLMYKSNNFQLKAYYTDKYHIRDLAGAEILSWFIANNEEIPDELLQANQFGTVTGMPCLLYFGDKFYGLATLKTHKSSDMFNLDDDNPNHIEIEANGKPESNWTTVTPVVGDTGAFSLESDNEANAQTATNALAEFIVNSSDEDFITNIDEHINVTSLCDYIIFNYLINNMDAWKTKNINYITYDGLRWFIMPYDFDASFNGYWRAGTIQPSDYDYFAEGETTNNLLLKTYRLLPNKLLDRFNELEKLGVLDLLKIQDVINRRITQIGQAALEMEWNRWPDNPAYKSKSRIDDMKQMIVVRKRLLKNKLESMQK